MSQEVTVALVRKNSIVDLDFESAALGRVHIDLDALPEDDRSGAAKRLLGEAALYCYMASLAKALETRGAPYEEIRGKATVAAGANEKGQSRVLGITLDVVARMDADYEDAFERVRKVLRHGCLITSSLEQAFPVTYNLTLECPDD